MIYLWLFSLSAVHTLVAVRYVKEEVLFVMFLVELAHCCTRGWDNIVDEEKQRVLRSQVNSLADEKVELSNYEQDNNIYFNVAFATTTAHYRGCQK